MTKTVLTLFAVIFLAACSTPAQNIADCREEMTRAAEARLQVRYAVALPDASANIIEEMRRNLYTQIEAYCRENAV